MTLPNKRPVLLPTKRELKALGWMALGAWLALGVRELLSHTPLNRPPVEAQRVAAMARDAQQDRGDLEIVYSFNDAKFARQTDAIRDALQDWQKRHGRGQV